MIKDNEYIFIVMDKEDDKDTRIITTDVTKVYDVIKKCYDPQIEIWCNEKYIDGCGIDEKANLIEIKELLSKYTKKDVFKFLDILNNSKSRYSIFRNVLDEKEKNLYTIIKLPYDYISFYFSEKTGKLIRVENERSLKNVTRCN